MTFQSTFSGDPPELRNELLAHARKNWWAYSMGEQLLINRYNETHHASDLPFRLKLLRNKLIRNGKKANANG